MKRSKIKSKNRAFIITPQFINRFEAHLKRRGHTVSTTRSYLSSARHFIYWMKTRPINDRRISNKTIQFFVNEHLPDCSCPPPVCKEIKTVRASMNQILLMEGVERIQANIDRSTPAIERTIRSFLYYAGLQEPSSLSGIQKVFAIPMKRFERPMITFLYLEEIQKIIETPDSNTWSGRRDRTLFAILYNTGARISEIVNIKCLDIEDKQCTALHLHGKGRKHRVVPLWKRTSKSIRQWLPQIDQNSHSPLFPNRFGKIMTRSGVEKQLRSAVSKALKQCPSLAGKKVSPHTIRHTTAMHLLQSGVDLSVIALWLGHESITTTHQYMQADIEMKKRALNKMKAPKIRGVKFKPSKDVLSFLDSL
ncbi:MAG: site-specific integrase [Desulfobacula sp.]|nr:site-specific integrase [Desulfobacula sp.]